MTMHARQRTLKVVLMILGRPYFYTRKALIKCFSISLTTLENDFNEIKNAGLIVDFDAQFRYAILPDKSFKELKYLLPLSDEDQLKITYAIDRYANKREAVYLKKKIDSLYDFQRLGIRALRKPELEKFDMLKAAKRLKHRVVLENYRSNSNEIRNREVEPFYIDSKEGMLQAFDVDDQDSKHFKISRINRVRSTEVQWSFEKRHFRKSTDVFRIANNDIIRVHLQIDVYAFNALIENYPIARADVMNGAEPNTYDFDTEVNAGFLGLTNFIMGNRGHVKILGPDILKDHILKEAQKIIDHIKEQE